MNRLYLEIFLFVWALAASLALVWLLKGDELSGEQQRREIAGIRTKWEKTKADLESAGKALEEQASMLERSRLDLEEAQAKRDTERRKRVEYARSSAKQAARLIAEIAGLKAGEAVERDGRVELGHEAAVELADICLRCRDELGKCREDSELALGEARNLAAITENDLRLRLARRSEEMEIALSEASYWKALSKKKDGESLGKYLVGGAVGIAVGVVVGAGVIVGVQAGLR